MDASKNNVGNTTQYNLALSSKEFGILTSMMTVCRLGSGTNAKVVADMFDDLDACGIDIEDNLIPIKICKNKYGELALEVDIGTGNINNENINCI